MDPAIDGLVRHCEPTYRIKPSDSQKFSPSAVKLIIASVVDSILSQKAWNGEEETVWTVSITDQIKAKVKELNYPRYKIVVQVVVGQNKQQGVRIASRCLWDANSDSFASYSFKNDSVWCSAIVFGIYTE